MGSWDSLHWFMQRTRSTSHSSSLNASAECEDECDVDLVLCINQCSESQDPTNCSRNCFDDQERCRRGCPCHDGCYEGCSQCPEISQCVECLPESECRDVCTDKLCADQIQCEIYNSYCMDDARRDFDACEASCLCGGSTPTPTPTSGPTTGTTTNLGGICPNGISFVDCPYETESISKCSNIYGGNICCWNDNYGKCGKVDPYGTI